MIDSKTRFAVVSNKCLVDSIREERKLEYYDYLLKTDTEKTLEEKLFANSKLEERKEKIQKSLKSNFSNEELHDGRRVLNSQSARLKRLKKRLKTMFESDKNKYFLTLTFTNGVLLNTSVETRRTYIRKYLDSISNEYIANIDYGKETEREHYHAIITTDIEFTNQARNAKNGHIIPNTYNLTNFKYGLTTAKEIKIENETALSSYLLKFTNHALKETTKQQMMLYSRSQRK